MSRAPTLARHLAGYEAAAEFLALPVGTLRSMVSRGQIPHLRLTPRVVRFDLDEIAAWLETKRRGGSGGAP